MRVACSVDGFVIGMHDIDDTFGNGFEVGQDDFDLWANVEEVA